MQNEPAHFLPAAVPPTRNQPPSPIRRLWGGNPASRARLNLRFWLAYWALNCALFLPLYLFSTDGSSFWPSLRAESSHQLFKQLAQFRNNFDIFRLNVEWAITTGLWVGLSHWLMRRRRLQRVLVLLLGLLYVLIFYYYLYEAITISFFLVDPIFYNHFFMAVDGLRFLLEHLDLPLAVYLGALLIFAALHVALWRLLRTVFFTCLEERFHWGSKTAVITLSALAVLSVWRFEVALANPVMVASSVAYKVHKNVAESLEIVRSVGNYRDEVVQQTYDYSAHELQTKPHIYLLAVESYGSVLYKRPHFRHDYVALLRELENELRQYGWYAASNFSTATTWGGGSWMSYGSLLFGIRIDVHPQFLFMRNKYRFATYPDIGHYLKSQGYRYFRISSLAVEMTDHEWEQYVHFYGVDEWLRYRDMNYGGERYSWGPSPPDQYTLGLLQEQMKLRAPDQPHLAFMITQNSHFPWSPLPPLASDWRDFNEAPFPGIDPSPKLSGLDAQRANYLAAIENQLRVLVDFITKHDEDAIFVLFGDHQPPRVARRSDGFETPMHIIGRSPALAKGLEAYGFQPGLTVRDQTHPIKHEGFYSLFVRMLVEQFGQVKDSPPLYLPNGVDASAPQ